MQRDEFSSSTKSTLARRVAFKCSSPKCQITTSGPHSESDRSISIGVAAHITAAAAGGPRYDSNMSVEDRTSIENGIWLCQSCAKLIDSDNSAFTVDILKNWKVVAEAGALRAMSGTVLNDFFPQPTGATHTPIPKIAGLTYDQAREKLLEVGWQPQRQHWFHAGEFDIQYGNGLHFWDKGYHEIINASGTGLSHCTFGFVDVYQNKLIIVTAGEVNEPENWTAYVWNWYLSKYDA